MNAAAPSGSQDFEHPAPQRANASLLALWTALALGPAAWFLQLAIETPLLSSACYPHDVPFVGALPDVRPVILWVDVVALAIVGFSAFVAWRTWRRTAGEKTGDGHRLMASGDGRTRFMAMSGLIANGMVGMAMVYTVLTHALLRGCGT